MHLFLNHYCFATIAEHLPIVTSVSPIIQDNNLAGGNTITITGSGFVEGATVSVQGIPCPDVNFVSVTSLTCITPPMSARGSYPIKVTNPDTGFSASTTVVVEYKGESGG